MIRISRRKMLANISTLAMGSALVSCGSTHSNYAQPAVIDLETLAGVAYDLFPYQMLPAELYVKVAENLLQSNNPLIITGLQQLKSNSQDRPWSSINESSRIRSLSSIENTAFFALVRTTTIETIYREPELFELLGYGGSAIEQGGYINRGFDDINWLSEAN